jgi:hypothetical protein
MKNSTQPMDIPIGVVMGVGSLRLAKPTNYPPPKVNQHPLMHQCGWMVHI